MAFIKRPTSKAIVDNPVTLFRDLRNRKVNGLLDHQSHMLTEYHKIISKSNIALELPTGSGKTLVGLLIAEYRRRVYGESIVYLCPTKQLANQVVEQSKVKYGIKTSIFVDKQIDYDPESKAEYTRAGTIAVTTYSGLFNTNTFFKEPDVIILDDAHATENYISKYWSLNITRKDDTELYKSIAELIKQILPESSYHRLLLTEPSQNDITWVDKIPTNKFHEIISDFSLIVGSYASSNNLRFPWSVIKDNLHACHVYISWSSILVRPIIPPTLTFSPFANAKQRVFMSATLGESGDLERLTGIPHIHKLPIPEGWDKQGIGRKLFFFPEAKLNEEDALTFAIEMTNHTNRSLILVPDDPTVEKLKSKIKKETNNSIFNAKDIEISKDKFIKSDNAVALLANRFDGIDFLDDDCRYLILMGLPKATHLQEKFMMSRMSASILFHDRIRTRLIQAVGRCTRSAVDYAAICVLGQDLMDELIPEKKLKKFHPELQAEIFYGHDQSIAVADKNELLENLNIFLEHGEDWNYADEDILQERNKRTQTNLVGSESLLKAATFEVNYQYAIWRNDYDNAMIQIGQILEQLNENDLKGYRGFWYYIAGITAWLAVKNGISSYQNQINENFQNAAKCTSSVTWLHNLARKKDEIFQKNDEYLPHLIEGLEIQLDKIGRTNDSKFESKAKEIITKISSLDGKEFEEGHESLGEFLGYQAGNSNKIAAPDPWWIIGDSLCFAFEDKIHENAKTPIHVKDIKQASGHPLWLRENINTLNGKTRIIPVVLTTSIQIDEPAVTFSEGIYYWNRSEFVDWAIKAIQVIRILRKRYNGSGDLVWRSEAIEEFIKAQINPANLINNLERNLVKSLPTQLH